MKTKIINNPLMCDPEKGFCEMQGMSDTATTYMPQDSPKTIQIIYFTDPICSSCWVIEPQLKKLKLEYGKYFNIEYRMGGLLPDWSYNSGGISKPSDVAKHWDEVSRYSGMPIDGDVWLEDPLPSSYPPSIAFKAAQFQDEYMANAFLRRIREMVFLEKKNIAKWKHLQHAAQEVGLDTNQLKSDMEGRGLVAFQEDLKFTKASGVRGFPTIIFSNQQNDYLTVYGSKPYETFESAIIKLLPGAVKTNIILDAYSLFEMFPGLTTKEFSALTNTSLEMSELKLNELYQENFLTKYISKNGILWLKASK